jgi:hypothetical protein
MAGGRLILRCSKKLKSIFEMISSKNQPIKPKISSIENKKRGKIQEKHEYLHQTPDISAILKTAHKQKQMVYMGHVDNISTFADWKKMLYWQRYEPFCESYLFQQKSIQSVCAAILNS